MKATEHELWQDERAATLRYRDRHREPQLQYGRSRHVSRSVRMHCPCCRWPVYAAADSDGETVTCTHCHAQLETFQIDGVVTLEIATPDLSPDGDM